MIVYDLVLTLDGRIDSVAIHSVVDACSGTNLNFVRVTWRIHKFFKEDVRIWGQSAERSQIQETRLAAPLIP